MTTTALVSASRCACAIVGLGGMAAWWFGGRRAVTVVRLLALGCLALVGAAWAMRFVEAGHLPMFGTYEAGLSLALAMVGVALGAELRRRDGDVGPLPLALLMAFAVLTHASAFDARAWALTISERSWVVELHGAASWLAFAAFTLQFAAAVRVLVVGESADDERVLVGALHYGFVLQSLMMALGSVYKFMLFGSSWSFDPIETMAMVVWAAYATILHLHLFMGVMGRRLAGWSLLGFLLLVVAYKGILYFPAWSTYHILDIGLRLHVGG